MEATALRAPSIVPYERWEAEASRLAKQFDAAKPFRHVVLDGFLDADAAHGAVADFPRPDSPEWMYYRHINERKLAATDLTQFSPHLQHIFEELLSPRFVKLIERITGIDGLLADKTLEGGGLHQITRGGFLNMHTDFTVHPHKPEWRRRVNVIIYLNEGWLPEYRGELELWDADVKNRVRSIAPVFNRCVVFDTTPPSFHGHPDPLQCPEHMTRKSLALYYFTHDASWRLQSTDYRARPSDGWRKYLIGADKYALRLYDRAKRKLGIKDSFTTRVMSVISGRRR